MWLGIRFTVLVSLAGAIAASPALAGTSGAAFKVTSTLDGKTVLPHRIHWLASTKLPHAKVAEVLFLIDGKVGWVEHNPPYTYGDDGNWLVTSFLSPGKHHFKVIVTASDGSHVSDQTVARVLPAAAPPAALTGTWQRTLTAAEAGKQPTGTWTLMIDKVGWRITVPPGGANLIDVAYLSSDVLESRGGIWTKPRPTDNPYEGNGWCENTNQPVRYRWAVTADNLTLNLAGPSRCDGESQIWAGTWTRKA